MTDRLSEALHDNADLAAKLSKALRNLADAEARCERLEAVLSEVEQPAVLWGPDLNYKTSTICAGEPDRLRCVAAAIRDGRPGSSVRLTRLVDGASTYTAEVQGVPPREFDDRDEAMEWAGEVAALVQARAVAKTLTDGTASDREDRSSLKDEVVAGLEGAIVVLEDEAERLEYEQEVEKVDGINYAIHVLRHTILARRTAYSLLPQSAASGGADLTTGGP